MLMFDRQRAFGLMMVTAIASGLFLYLHSVSYMLDGAMGNALVMLELSRVMGYVGPVMPLIAALPFGTGLCQDVQAGYSGTAVLRAGKGKYLASKALSCALAGGIASLASMLLFLMVAHFIYPSDFSAPDMLETTYLHALLKPGGIKAYLLYYGARLFLVFMSGMFWAMCAMCFSAFYPNLALTLVCPPVVWRLLAEAAEVFHFPDYLDAAYLDEGSASLQPGAYLLGAFALYGLLTLTLFIVFYLRGRRRLLGDER